MSWFYRRLVRPVLFSQPPERIHDWTIASLGWISHQPLFCDALASFFLTPPLPIRCFGLDFPNPVGLAAGMDKGAEAVPAWAALGFGFAELGAVTWQHAQRRRNTGSAEQVSRVLYHTPEERVLEDPLEELLQPVG